MSKLLSANFLRLRHSRLFWAGMLLMFLFGLLPVLSLYNMHVRYGYDTVLDSTLFSYTILIGLVTAIFTSLFVGTDYSDGTIRNKLIVGHTRIAIYLANLVTTGVAALLFCLSCLVSTLALGLPLLGAPVAGLQTLCPLLFGSLLLALAFAAIYTMVGMVCSNKAAVAVICLVALMLLMIGSSWVVAMLAEPEFYENYSLTDGEMEVIENVRNPRYPTGVWRDVLEFLNDFLPTGQSMQYGQMQVAHPWLLALWSFLIALGATLAGALVFRRKDIQ